jgi:hypothetical protein
MSLISLLLEPGPEEQLAWTARLAHLAYCCEASGFLDLDRTMRVVQCQGILAITIFKMLRFAIFRRLYTSLELTSISVVAMGLDNKSYDCIIWI